MKNQKIKEHMKAFEAQQKQLAAMKKGGKSSRQAVEEMKNRLQNKQNKVNKGKKGSAVMADEGNLIKILSSLVHFPVGKSHHV